MADLPDASIDNGRPISAADWFDARFRKPNDGKPYSPRTRAKHLKRLGIEILWVGWTPVLDPAIADQQVLKLAAEQSAKITRAAALTPYVGPAWRQEPGIAEEEIAAMVSSGALERHPERPGDVRITSDVLERVRADLAATDPPATTRPRVKRPNSSKPNCCRIPRR